MNDMFKVQELSSGSLLIQATAEPEDMNAGGLHRLFLGLVDVLPDGTPMPSPPPRSNTGLMYWEPQLTCDPVVHDDPSEYR